MTRMSSLPIAERCGAAAGLSARHGSGRPAAMSRAFHALCAEDPQAFRLFAALAPIEKEEVNGWKRPADVTVNGWCVLDYASAVKELEVGLDCWGDYVDPKVDDFCPGHLDFAWLREIEGVRVAFVADIKKSVWTTPDGPDSLQIHAYGRAFAKKVGAHAYCVGIWAATEAKWLWDTEIIQLDGPKANELLDRILFAAANSGEASTGPHCRQCYARLHCDEYLLPAVTQQALVRKAVQDGVFGETATVDADDAAAMLDWAERAKDLAKFVNDNLRERVRRGEVVIEDEDGRVWAPITKPGKVSVDMDVLKAMGGESALKYGAPFEEFRWRKPK